MTSDESELFEGRVQRSYRLDGQRVVIFGDDYQGDVQAGDSVELELDEGKWTTARVLNVLWGSAFHARKPPMTLVLEGEEPEPAAGRVVRSGPSQ